MASAHTLEFAPLQAGLELKKAFEAYWRGDASYLDRVPEFTRDQRFEFNMDSPLDEVEEARTQGKRVIIGPLTYLWLGKAKAGNFDTLELLDRLLPIYGDLLGRLAGQGVEWVQIDEPILSLELPQDWKNAFERAYHTLQYSPLKKLIATDFGGLEVNLGLAVSLAVNGLHVDLVRAPEQLPTLLDRLPTYKVLSLGVATDLNVWRCDLRVARELLSEAKARFGENLWITDTGALLVNPVDQNAA